MSEPSLLEEGQAVIAAVSAYIARSEDREAYRRGRGRTLSKQHREQLGDVLAQVDALRERLQAILTPPPDVAELYRQFEAICERFRKSEEGGSDGSW